MDSTAVPPDQPPNQPPRRAVHNLVQKTKQWQKSQDRKQKQMLKKYTYDTGLYTWPVGYLSDDAHAWYDSEPDSATQTQTDDHAPHPANATEPIPQQSNAAELRISRWSELFLNMLTDLLHLTEQHMGLLCKAVRTVRKTVELASMMLRSNHRESTIGTVSG